MRAQTSAAGVLALLSEPEAIFKQHALKALNPLVPRFWAEISEYIAQIESLYESEELPKESRDDAALLASKVYYYLGEYDEALSFAIGAGAAFTAETSASGSEEYVETVVSKAIDRYVQLRSDEGSEEKKNKVDPRLLFIIESILERCIQDGEFKQAIGVALESRRLDVIQKIYEQTRDTTLLSYAMDAVLDTGFSLSYRDEVLRFLYPIYPHASTSDGALHIHSLLRLLVALSDVSLTISLLQSLIPKDKLLAYQLAFDLVEGGSQDFLEGVRSSLPEGDEATKELYDTLRLILHGQESIKLYLQFLKRNNQTDLVILKNTKQTLEQRSSIYHNALTLQNAFMNSGTTSDIFLRENLEWLGLANNWSKFTATAALGVIHKGYFEHGRTILNPYLPSPIGGESNISGVVYQEGGALYALGLINAGCGLGNDVTDYLRDTLKAGGAHEVIQHGAALGLGIAAMGSQDEAIFEDLKAILFNDSAVAGEASGFSMGLAMMGTANLTCVDEMLAYARETQHEKIIRGLAVGTAFIFYGKQEQSDATVKALLADKDPILRYGGVYTLALAYAGTSDNNAVRQLLHIAVSDTSDDVRRAAVTSLAFLLFKNPSQVPRIVQLLSESYNPHVRCGATLALGIACAGTGLQDAIDILEPMTKDSVDFVRQGAFIALAMILVQQSEASAPSLAPTRALYNKVITDKHEDPMAKFGAALSQGLIDAGGRNVTISLQSRAGSTKADAVVGMVLFCQFWYWYPLAHCACLTFQPTPVIGLDGDLKLPKFEFTSNARPSLFAYPPLTKPPTKEAVTKVATAVLSTTAKVKAREKKKAAAEDAMDTDEKDTKETEESEVEEEVKEKPKKEPTSESKSNFSRVTPSQLRHISFSSDARYQPVRMVWSRSRQARTTGLEKSAGGGGILIFADLRPEEPAEFIDIAPEPIAEAPPATEINPATSNPVSGPHIALDENSPEADPPEPFEYPFGNDS